MEESMLARESERKDNDTKTVLQSYSADVQDEPLVETQVVNIQCIFFHVMKV
jgi:hypothetical protein